MSAVPEGSRVAQHERPGTPPGALAAGRLFHLHAGRVLAYCRRELRSPEEAEDAVQATFLNAYRALARGVVPEAELPWLLKIAENVCLTRRRSSFRRGRVERPHDLDDIPDAAAPERGDTTAAELLPALRALPESQRRAFILREWKGLSYREICAELELSESAVETLIFRARRALASALAPERVRRRVRGFGSNLDFGSLLAGAKAAVATAVPTSLATGVAVVATATTLTVDPPLDRFLYEPPTRQTAAAAQPKAPPPAVRAGTRAATVQAAVGTASGVIAATSTGVARGVERAAGLASTGAPPTAPAAPGPGAAAPATTPGAAPAPPATDSPDASAPAPEISPSPPPPAAPTAPEPTPPAADPTPAAGHESPPARTETGGGGGGGVVVELDPTKQPVLRDRVKRDDKDKRRHEGRPAVQPTDQGGDVGGVAPPPAATPPAPTPPAAAPPVDLAPAPTPPVVAPAEPPVAASPPPAPPPELGLDHRIDLGEGGAGE